MTDVLRIAHPQNCPPYGNSRVGICEGNLLFFTKYKITKTKWQMRFETSLRKVFLRSNIQLSKSESLLLSHVKPHLEIFVLLC